MPFQPGEIYLIHLDRHMSSRIFLRIIELDGQLHFLPFNIERQEPIPIAALESSILPLLLGCTRQDHDYFENYISTNLAAINLLMWNRIQRQHGRGKLGELLAICGN